MNDADLSLARKAIAALVSDTSPTRPTGYFEAYSSKIFSKLSVPILKIGVRIVAGLTELIRIDLDARSSAEHFVNISKVDRAMQQLIMFENGFKPVTLEIFTMFPRVS